jgi:hypothetical protein
MAKVFTMPDVVVQLTPELRVLVNGADRTGEYQARAAVTLSRLGKFAGWALRQFETPFYFERSKTVPKAKEG